MQMKVDRKMFLKGFSFAAASSAAASLLPGCATANVRQEVEDAVRDGRKDCLDAKGNLVCRYNIEQD